MDDLYKSKQYISIVLEQLKEAVEDIEIISVSNDDFLNEQASELSERVTEIRKIVEKRFGK
jgi:uncharacterized protein YnzC (UPF0291/DUF896 family)